MYEYCLYLCVQLDARTILLDPALEPPVVPHELGPLDREVVAALALAQVNPE